MRLDPDHDYTVELGLDEPDDPAALTRKLAAQLEVRSDARCRRSSSASARSMRGAAACGSTSSSGRRRPRRSGSAARRCARWSGPPVVIVGGGPAGLFCAYELARAGVKSVIVLIAASRCRRAGAISRG